MEYSNELLGQLREKAKRLRRGVIECIGVGNAGHVGGGCSCADIVAALYFYKMRYDPKDPAKKDRDRFLLSKGHAAIVQYAALAEAFAVAAACKGKPTVLLARTVKGKGVSFMEGDYGWHGKAPNAEQYEKARAELAARVAELEGK